MRPARVFGNATDLQSLTGLNQAAMENETGNQSAVGGQQQQSNQSASNQTGNQSVASTGSANRQNELKSNLTGTAKDRFLYKRNYYGS
jgi:hypothetical protein